MNDGTRDPMAVRRIRFAYLPGEPAIDCRPPHVDLNLDFRDAVMRNLAPLKLAQRLGRLSETTARRALARAYAEGVVTGSPTAALEQLDTEGWEEWLLANPDEFDELRRLLDDHKVWLEGRADVAG